MDILVMIVAAVVLLLLLLGFLLSDADPILLLFAKFGKSPTCLANKVIWITGASSGIGEYLAYELAKNGCKLILSATRTAELERVKRACLAKSSLSKDDIMVLPFDVTNLHEHQQHVGNVLKYFKRIDILVNNAGRSQRGWFSDTPISIDRELFEVNVFAVISLTKAVLPHMLEQKQGHIVIMSSLAGKLGVPFSASYSATKYALQGLFSGLQAEMTGKNIDVSLICPGPIRSAVMKNAFTSKPGEKYGIDIPQDAGHMATERCAYLTTVAMANRLFEVFITRQPLLLACFMFTHFPTVSLRLLQIFGMKKFMKMREAGAKTTETE